MNLLIQEALELLGVIKIQIDLEVTPEVMIIILMYILAPIEEVSRQELIILPQGEIQP